MTCKNRLLALCLGTMLVFFAQSMMCFAQEIGAVPCCSQIEQEHTTGSDHQHESSTSDSCCMCYHGTIMPVEAADLSCEILAATVSVGPEKIVPDGPVYEIDYPPQLS